MKLVLSFGTEIAIIGFILFTLFATLFSGFSRLAGEAYYWITLFFVIVFFIDSIFYIVLRFVLLHKEKTFLKLLSAVLLTLPIIIALYFVITSTGGFKLFALPFLVPLFVFGLRYLFLKILARKG